MHYFGGKARIGKEIAIFLNHIREDGQPYWEPFVGAVWVLMHIQNMSLNYASDACYELIELLKALQAGWIPPDFVSEKLYQEAKGNLVSPRLRAFVGFGCSFGGKWFAGYARRDRQGEKNYNYALTAKYSLLRKIARIPPTKFFHADYGVAPPASSCLVYCDPPYAGATGYGAVGAFDTDQFWVTARQWVREGHTVVASEYRAPDDFVCVLTIQTKIDMQTKNGHEAREEKVFMHKTQAVYPLQQLALWDTTIDGRLDNRALCGIIGVI